MSVSAFCFCAPVTQAALEALLEVSERGQGAYRDTHPWLVAQQLWRDGIQPRTASTDPSSDGGDQPVIPLILAVQERGALSHYGFVEEIDVVELHRGSWESRCRFGRLQPVNPLWEGLDSLMLWPAAEQHRREEIEGIRQHRTALSAGTLHPYAICETPAFISQV